MENENRREPNSNISTRLGVSLAMLGLATTLTGCEAGIQRDLTTSLIGAGVVLGLGFLLRKKDFITPGLLAGRAALGGLIGYFISNPEIPQKIVHAPWIISFAVGATMLHSLSRAVIDGTPGVSNVREAKDWRDKGWATIAGGLSGLFWEISVNNYQNELALAPLILALVCSGVAIEHIRQGFFRPRDAREFPWWDKEGKVLPDAGDGPERLSLEALLKYPHLKKASLVGSIPSDLEPILIARGYTITPVSDDSNPEDDSFVVSNNPLVSAEIRRQYRNKDRNIPINHGEIGELLGIPPSEIREDFHKPRRR